jgi:predicted RNA-binding protein
MAMMVFAAEGVVFRRIFGDHKEAMRKSEEIDVEDVLLL